MGVYHTFENLSRTFLKNSKKTQKTEKLVWYLLSCIKNENIHTNCEKFVKLKINEKI